MNTGMLIAAVVVIAVVIFVRRQIHRLIAIVLILLALLVGIWSIFGAPSAITDRLTEEQTELIDTAVQDLTDKAKEVLESGEPLPDGNGTLKLSEDGEELTYSTESEN